MANVVHCQRHCMVRRINRISNQRSPSNTNKRIFSVMGGGYPQIRLGIDPVENRYFWYKKLFIYCWPFLITSELTT